MSKQAISETLLCRNLKSGDEEAFKEIYRLYKNKLYYFAMKLTKSQIDADEIVQQAFIALWVTRSELDVTQSVSGFLYRIVKNKVYNFLRDMAVSEKAKRAFLYSADVYKDITDDDIANSEYESHLLKVVNTLPKQKKLIFEMTRIQGLSHDEVASKLGISKNTVKNHMVESLKLIKDYMVVNFEFSFIFSFLVFLSF